MTQTAPKNMRDFLDQTSTKVKEWETKGQVALAGNSVDEYRLCMLEKAKLLANIQRQGQAYIPTLPSSQQALVADRLRAFSASATNAISLNSVFYMSALLYPDDYVQGTPNDLEIFCQGLPE